MSNVETSELLDITRPFTRSAALAGGISSGQFGGKKFEDSSAACMSPPRPFAMQVPDGYAPPVPGFRDCKLRAGAVPGIPKRLKNAWRRHFLCNNYR